MPHARRRYLLAIIAVAVFAVSVLLILRRYPKANLTLEDCRALLRADSDYRGALEDFEARLKESKADGVGVGVGEQCGLPWVSEEFNGCYWVNSEQAEGLYARIRDLRTHATKRCGTGGARFCTMTCPH